MHRLYQVRACKHGVEKMNDVSDGSAPLCLILPLKDVLRQKPYVVRRRQQCAGDGLRVTVFSIVEQGARSSIQRLRKTVRSNLGFANLYKVFFQRKLI